MSTSANRTAAVCLGRLGVVALAACLANQVALADIFPATFIADTNKSAVNLTADLNGSISLGSAVLMGSGGNLAADIEQSGAAPPPLSVANVQGNFDVVDTSTSGGVISLTLQGIVLSIGPGAGPFLTDGANPASIDLSGLPLSVEQGLVFVGATQVYDFSATPSFFDLDPGTLGTLTETGGPGVFNVSLEFPFRVGGSTSVPEGTLNYAFDGIVAFVGTKTVPEPSGIALAAVALVGLVALSRCKDLLHARSHKRC